MALSREGLPREEDDDERLAKPNAAALVRKNFASGFRRASFESVESREKHRSNDYCVLKFSKDTQTRRYKLVPGRKYEQLPKLPSPLSLRNPRNLLRRLLADVQTVLRSFPSQLRRLSLR